MQGLPELTIGRWLIAWFPIAMVLTLMMVFKWSGGKSGAVSWVASLLVGILFFGADIAVLASGTIKGLWTTVFVIYIIWGAMTLYNVVDVTGSFKIIASKFVELTHGNKLLQLLVLGWAFPSFIQGVCGFGIPVAISAPLLISLGFAPVTAVVVPLIGHTWSVTFGSLGSSYSVLVRLTELDPIRLAAFGAMFLGIGSFMSGISIAHYYKGWKGVKEGLPAIIIIGIAMAGTLNIMANFVTPYLSSFTAGIAGLLVGGLVVTRLKIYKPIVCSAGRAEKGNFSFITAFSAYLILIAVVFAVYLIKPLKLFLNELWVLGLPFPETQTVFGYQNQAATKYASINMLTAPGTLIFLAAFLSYLFYRFKKLWPAGGGKMVLNRTVNQVAGATVTVFTMSMMAVVMTETGMTTYMAYGMAKYTGSAYVVISPFIGLLGSFMTGSNTNSNILFTLLQNKVATLLGVSPFIILGLQTAGGAIGTMFSPTNVALGTGVTKNTGREGECLKATSLYAVVQALVLGILAWLMIYIFSVG